MLTNKPTQPTFTGPKSTMKTLEQSISEIFSKETTKKPEWLTSCGFFIADFKHIVDFEQIYVGWVSVSKKLRMCAFHQTKHFIFENNYCGKNCIQR